MFVHMLYPSISHNEGLEVLKKQLNDFDEKSIITKDFTAQNMSKYVFSLTRILPHKDRIQMRARILTYFTQCLVKMAEFVFKNKYIWA